MTRIACLYIPLFPLAARLRAEPELAGEIVAICEGNGAAARVVAASRPARKAGLRAGMSMAQARGILPALIARGRDPGCESSAHEALLETAWSLSPRVEDAEFDLVFADVDGMHNLYDGERDLGQAAEVTANAMDLPIRVGVAGRAVDLLRPGDTHELEWEGRLISARLQFSGEHPETVKSIFTKDNLVP